MATVHAAVRKRLQEKHAMDRDDLAQMLQEFEQQHLSSED
jgi:hypothetical protein